MFIRTCNHEIYNPRYLKKVYIEFVDGQYEILMEFEDEIALFDRADSHKTAEKLIEYIQFEILNGE